MNEQENKNVPSTGIEIDLEKDGLDIASGQTDFASAERIMMRQRGTRIHPGQNVGIGKDDTLFTKAERVTGFERSGKDRREANAYTQ